MRARNVPGLCVLRTRAVCRVLVLFFVQFHNCLHAPFTVFKQSIGDGSEVFLWHCSLLLNAPFCPGPVLTGKFFKAVCRRHGSSVLQDHVVPMANLWICETLRRIAIAGDCDVSGVFRTQRHTGYYSLRICSSAIGKAWLFFFSFFSCVVETVVHTICRFLI